MVRHTRTRPSGDACALQPLPLVCRGLVRGGLCEAAVGGIGVEFQRLGGWLSLRFDVLPGSLKFVRSRIPDVLHFG
jgi:hypothetical protein